MVVVCYFCGYTKKMLHELADHMRSKHTKERPVTCPQCSKTLASTRSLRLHKEIHHSVSERAKCLQCHKSFTTKAYLKHHVVNVHGVQTYECEQCNFKTATTYRLRNHSRIHEKNRVRNFVCDICQKGFFTYAERRQHSRIHSNSKNIKHVACYFCGCVTNTFTLADHMRSKHTKERPVKCAQCSMTFTSRSTLQGHKERHHSTSEKVKCSQCPKSFQTKNVLQQHVVNVHGEQKYKCEHCTFKTVTSLRLRKHSRIHEKSRVRNFVCGIDICRKGFFTQAELKNHSRIHSNSKNIKHVACYFCGCVTNTFNLADHIRSKHTKERPAKCSQCFMTFASLGTLHHHKFTSHSGSERVKCLQCPKSYRSKGELQQHVRGVHRIEKYECDQCNYKTTTKTRLRTHSLIHEKNRKRKFVCEICKKGFFDVRTLNFHLRTHSKSRKQFPCYFCPNIYAETSSLYGHLPFHTKELSVGGAGKKCKQCSAVSDNHKELQKHVRIEHGVERPYKCNICGVKEDKPSGLERHMATKHSSLRPFQCNTCPATFNLLSTLKGHIKAVHFGVREYCCDKCPKMFTTPTVLKYHVQSVHSATKPFPCTICGARFRMKHILTYHVKSKHEPKRDQCYFCSRQFTLFYNYRDHLYTHTKERPFNCILNVEGKPCRFTAFKKYLLKDHVRAVHEGHQFQCSSCSFKTTTRGGLYLHITQIHTRGRAIKCDKCGWGFSNRVELRNHRC